MKKNKNKSIRSKILGKYFAFVFIITVLWILGSVLSGGIMYDLVCGIFDIFYYWEMDSHIQSIVYYSWCIISYLLFVAMFTLIYLSRTARFLDKSYQAFSGIIDEENESPSLPKMIKPLYDKTESNIKNALKYRDYVAQEAEKRKNDLVVYLAHDLKTPLTSIIGYLTLLEEAQLTED